MVSAFCCRRKKNTKLQLYPALKQNKLTIFLAVKSGRNIQQWPLRFLLLSFPVITLMRIVSLPYLRLRLIIYSIRIATANLKRFSFIPISLCSQEKSKMKTKHTVVRSRYLSYRDILSFSSVNRKKNWDSFKRTLKSFRQTTSVQVCLSKR